MKNCDTYQELISRMLDGDLSKAERDELAAHVRSCPDCAAVYVAFRSLSENLGSDQEEPPTSVHENIMAEVRRDGLRRRNSVHRSHRGWHAALTAAACVVLIAAAGLSLPRIVGRSGAAAPAEVPMAAQSLYQTEAVTEEAAPMEREAAYGLVDAKNSAQSADDVPAEEPAEAAAELPEPAADSLWADTGRVLTLDEEQSAVLREHMTGEKLPIDGSAAQELQLSYLLDGTPTPLTVLLFEDKAVYVFADGDSYCLIDLSPEELLALVAPQDTPEN